MRFISCASYYGSGSSAITDFVSEFDSVYSFTDEEFRFVQDPDGVSDLEYNLVENFNRHNSGHAIKRYKKLVDFYCGNMFGKKYEKFFHGNWKKYSEEYIDDLTDFTYHGWWQYDLMDKGDFFYYEITKANVLSLKPYIDAHAGEKVLTHIDAVPDNFLFVEKEGREEIRLIDWEYAGMQDPHVDVAMFCIRNIKQYLLATLYNAPVTVDSYYSAQVRHEFGWGGRADKN